MAKKKKRGKAPNLQKQLNREKDKFIRKACETALKK